MSTSPQAPPSESGPEDRYARTCPDHPESELVGLDCPEGHRVASWLLFDRVKRTVTKGGDVDEDFRRRRAPVRPRPVLSPAEEERRRQMRARVESGAAGTTADRSLLPLPGPKPKPPGAKPDAPTVILESEAYTNPAGTVTMRVELVRKRLVSVSTPRFRVMWRQLVGKQQTIGVTHDGINEPDARAAFTSAKGAALKAGWIPRPNGKPIEIRPIPMAPKK